MNKERLRAYREMVKEQRQLKELLEAGETKELRLHYQQKLKELEAEQLEIEKAIDELEPTERMILRAYYIDGMTWEEVCVAVGYAWRQTHRIHSRALEKMQEQEKSHQ